MLLLLMFLCHFMEDHTVQGKTRLFYSQLCFFIMTIVFCLSGTGWFAAVLNTSLQGPTGQKLTVGMGLLCTEVQRCHLFLFDRIPALLFLGTEDR